MPRVRPALTVVACLVGAVVAQAEEPKRPELLYVSGQRTFSDAAHDGGGGGIEWLHPISTAAGVGLGAFAFTSGGSEWTYGKLEGYVTLPTATIVSGDLNLGRGWGPSGEFLYQVYKAEVVQALIDKHLYVALGDQYGAVGSSRDNVISPGIIVAPLSWLSGRFNYHVSAGGNVDSRFFSGRIDLTTKPVSFLLGAVVGQTTPVRFNVIGGRNRAVHAQELYGGVSLPLGAHELTVIVDMTRLPGIEKVSALLVWKIAF